MDIEWLKYYVGIAEVVRSKSKDNRTQIGAVIVNPHGKEIVSTGYNSFPRGIDDCKPERQESPEKYYWFSHAETNAIVNAARTGVSTMGMSIVVTSGVPCSDCARNIINSGITNVYCKIECTTTGDLWSEHAKRSLQMFHEAGVQVNYYNGNIILQ